MNFGTIQVADIFVGTLNATEAYFGTEKVWEKSEPPPSDPWLCFTAEQANSTVAMRAEGSAPTVSLEYSTNGASWSPFVVGTTTVTLANIGDKVYVRATSAGNTGIGNDYSNYNYFVMTGHIAASGNVDTLLDQNGNATLTSYCYYRMFQNCSSLTTAPSLPATTLAEYCYGSMFNGCSSLTSAPALPATTLASSCYSWMFNGCSSLATAPTLPATTLDGSCYSAMFWNCTSLTTAPELPATTLAYQCYSNMFRGCSSLVSVQTISATTLDRSCCYRMFYDCTSLTTAPATLPATTLADSCYKEMFYNCTSLTTAPELPATTLINDCYVSMFYNCKLLNNIKIGYTGEFYTTYTSTWTRGVSSTGTFYYNGTSTSRGDSYIPTGWTITPFTP